MNLDQIETKCFILALFIRDDGERFLLGSRAYEFVDSQLHFVANSYQNDIVEVQGNDGVMLAGQVRRGTSQPFDGYIGDQTVDRSTIEQYRRDFMKFFRKNHYYKVVYVFPDGSAVQRRNGFIVEAPEVKELYQLFPQYHISMNFEDINYYVYEEDSDGEEIYGESAILKIATSATGGLIWEEGTESEITGDGSQFTLQDTIDGNVLDSVQLKGDTTQQTYSGKNLLKLRATAVTTAGVTFTPNVDGTFNLSGTSNSNYCEFNGVVPLASSGINNGAKYTISSNGIGNGITYYVHSCKQDGTWTKTLMAFDSNNLTKTCPEPNDDYIRFVVKVSNGTTVNLTNVKAQIESGSTATDFEPYVGGIPAPNPDYPQEVQVVTGEQTVTITDGAEESQEYTVDLGNIELCKIGTYQDYIYKSGDDWYLHRMVNKLVLDGSDDEQWGYANNGNFYCNANLYSGGLLPANDTSYVQMYCNAYISATYQASWTNKTNYTITARYDGNSNPRINNQDYTSANTFKAYLASNNVILYYPLATPTDIQITNADLIAQLEALLGATTYDGQTAFTVNSENQLAILDVTVIARTGGGVVWDNYGAEWEEGTGGGPTTVNIDSIDNVYPVLTLTGPAVNPQISVLTTNTTLSYSGTVTSSQELKIDMFNKTATLNGASVVGNVSGDWVYLKPGVNRITYTTNNADAPDSTIWWQEIVG